MDESVRDAFLVGWPTFITQMITENVVMWTLNTAQHCRLHLLRDSDFAEDLEDSKSTLAGILCIFGSRTFVPSVRCAKCKHECPTVPQNRNLLRWMFVCEWTEFLLSIYAMWWSKYCILQRTSIKQWKITVEKKKPMMNCREVRHVVKSKAPLPTPNRKETVIEKMMNCLKWITLWKAQNLFNSKLSCTLLETTKLWSKWS